MVDVLAPLTAAERQAMYDAVPLVAVLVAGADGNIDEQEKEWATKVVHIRGYAEHGAIREFYEGVDQAMPERMQEIIDKYPRDEEARRNAIALELGKLNAILPKLHPGFAATYYESLVSYAKHIAKASGGFLGFMAIGPEEKKVIDLPMIVPFHHEDEV